MIAWTLSDGIALINKIKSDVESVGFSVGLTGGVLFRGASEKDLDLVFYPMGRIPAEDYCEVLNLLKEKLKLKSMVSVDHLIDSKLVISAKDDSGRRLDFFFPSEKFETRRDGLFVAGSTLAYSGATKLEEEEP